MLLVFERSGIELQMVNAVTKFNRQLLIGLASSDEHASIYTVLANTIDYAQEATFSSIN